MWEGGAIQRWMVLTDILRRQTTACAGGAAACENSVISCSKRREAFNCLTSCRLDIKISACDGRKIVRFVLLCVRPTRSGHFGAFFRADSEEPNQKRVSAKKKKLRNSEWHEINIAQMFPPYLRPSQNRLILPNSLTGSQGVEQRP